MMVTLHNPSASEQRMPRQPVKLLLTVKEACVALSLGRTYVHGLLATGQLFSVKVGGRRLIPVAALHEFVERLTKLQKAS